MTQENQNINSHIEEYLHYYCQLSHAPGFAVLLKGQWGSGKTWFINKYIEKLKKQKNKCVYVSLYGMTSFSEIEEVFFQQLNPILSSKGMALAGKIFKGIIKTTVNIDLNSDGKSDGNIRSDLPDIKLSDYIMNTKNSILIFDDLERCKIELSNILGYINYFVEHEDLKVIVIANEEKLLENDNYKDIKEKLIGKTFAVSPDFDGALNDFINELDNAEIKKFLFENTALIKESYDKAKYNNLRCLKQIALDFERIFEYLPDKVKTKKELVQIILKRLIVFSIEIKRGEMLPTDIIQLEEEAASEGAKITAYPKNNSNIEEKNKEMTSLQKILSKYNLIQLNLRDPFPSQLWWQIFFDQGILDEQEFAQSLLESKYFQDENTPDWLKLLKFTYLDDDEFENLLKKVETEYADRKFIKLIEIKHITGLLLHFSNVGLYSKTKKEILQDSKHYIDYLRTHHEIEFIDNSTSSIENIYEPLKLRGKYGDFYGRDTQEFQDFFHYIDQIKAKVKDENLPNVAQDLLPTMQTDVWKFRTIICSSASRNQNIEYPTYYDTPIFKYIVAEEFTKQLLLMKPEDQESAVWALADRYDVYEKLLEELNWLKSVRNLLLEEANRNKGKLSEYRLKSLVENNLNEVIEKLEAKNSMNQ